MVDIEQELRCKVLSPALPLRELGSLEYRPCACADRRVDLLEDRIGRARADDRPQRGVGRERTAEHVLTRQLDPALDEGIMHPLVHVDALNPAAALSGIEVCAVDQVIDGVRDVGVVAHVGRVAAAEFEPRADKALRRRRAARHDRLRRTR